MADDIPIFEQKTAIQQGGALPSVGKALSQKPGYQMDIKKSLTDLDYYSKYAQQASSDLGQALGQIRGERPGGFVVPEIFENQKSFHDAYKKEEFVNLSYDGALALEKMKLLASRNPTRGNLQTYQKEGNKVIEDILDIASPGNKNELKRYLESNFDNGALNIAERNFKKEQEDMLHQGNIKQDQAIKNVYNNSFTGNKELSEKDKEIAIANVYSMINSHLINAEEGVKRIETIEKMQTRGEFDAKAKEWTDNGTFEENIKQYAENKPENITPIEHQENVANMMQYHNQYQSALSGQQYLTYMGTLNQIQSGVQLSPTQLDSAKQEMGPSYAVKLDHDLIKVSSKQNEIVNLSNEMQPDIGNPVKMSKWSDGDVDKVFNLRLNQAAQQAGVNPEEIPLTDQAQIASGMGAPVKSFTEKLENAVKYGGSEMATNASRAIRTLQHNSPVTISKLDKNANATANLYDLYARNTSINGEEALKAARNDVYNIDDNTKKQRIEAVDQWYKDKKYNNYNVKLKAIAEGIGVTSGLFNSANPKLVPAGLTTIVDGLVNSMAQRVPSPEIAWNMAMDELKKTYKETNTNNRKEIMALTPETTLPGNEIWQQNDKIRAIKNMVDKNKELKEKNGFVYNELDWPDAPDTNNLVDKLLVDGDIKINVDGKPSKIVIVSDIITQLSPIQQPSWQLNYIDEKGMQIPLMDMNGPNAVARWVPDISRLESEIKKREQRLFEEAKYKQEHRNDTKEFHLNQILETGID